MPFERNISTKQSYVRAKLAEHATKLLSWWTSVIETSSLN